MKLPPKKEERPDDPAFAAQTLARLPLAEAFYTAWAHVAPDAVLQQIFDANRGRCYDDTLTFPELVLALTNALTRHHGCANSALEQALDANALFRHTPRGSALDHFVAQSRLIVTGNREGGFFLMIGQRPAVAVPPVAAGEVRTVHA